MLPGAEVATRVFAIRVRNALKIVIVVDVALCAGQRGVCAIQNETGHAMVKSRSQPAIKIGVAILAIGGGKGWASAGVWRIVRFLPIGQMARLTFRGEAVENSRRCLLVARFALHCGVRSEQREAIKVILHLLNRDVPSLDGVALFAILPQLMTVNVLVGVTVDAILADIGKHGLNVAFRALHFFVHTAQGIFSLVVIEFGHCANGTPTCGGMAVLTRNGQGTMRTAGSGLMRKVPGRNTSELGKRQKKPAGDPQHHEIHDHPHPLSIRGRAHKSAVVGWTPPGDR